MRTITEINRQLREEYGHIAQLYTQVSEHQHNIKSLKEERKKAEEYRLKNFIDRWLMDTFGISSQKEARRGMFIVFDENAHFIRTVKCGRGAEFRYVSPPEETDTLGHWLRKNKLYAHNASSFCDRDYDWYQMEFKEQLKNLCWEFDGDGKISKIQPWM